MYCIAFLPSSYTLRFGDHYTLFFSKEEAMKFISIFCKACIDVNVFDRTETTRNLRLNYSNSITRTYVTQIISPLLDHFLLEDSFNISSLTSADLEKFFEIQRYDISKDSRRTYNFSLEIESDDTLKLTSV